MDKANHACMYGSCQSSKEITYNLKRKSNYIAYKKNILNLRKGLIWDKWVRIPWATL